MKILKRNLIILFSSLMIMGSSLSMASGVYTAYETQTLPGFNTSIYSGNTSEKTTSSDPCAVYVKTLTGNSQCDIRLVNSNGDARSDWMRNLATGVDKTATCYSPTAVGYNYQMEVSSDWNQFSDQDITFKFSSDNP
jgi:hypothetical protein